jgi:transposase, IS30 family
MAHTKFTFAERVTIGVSLTKKHSLRSIAKQLGKGHNAVAYEVQVNSVRGKYNAKKAHAKAQARAKQGRRGWMKIEKDPRLKKLVIAGLTNHWNPDEIAGELRKKKGAYVSKTAIYDWLRTSRGERYCEHLYSQRKVVKRRAPKTKKVMIPNRVSIEARSKKANLRKEPGHHERDTIVGRKGTAGGLATCSERMSRFVTATKVASMSPTEHAAVVIADSVKYFTKSITYDNGIENRCHESTGIVSYFCAPYHSWEKGGIENANKMIRRYFPKGTDFTQVTQEQVDTAVRHINNKPRKILGYRSALEVATKLGIIKSESVRLEG